jgi:hypothetical protein
MLHMRSTAHLDLHCVYVLLCALKDDEEHQVSHARSHQIDGHATPSSLVQVVHWNLFSAISVMHETVALVLGLHGIHW